MSILSLFPSSRSRGPPFSLYLFNKDHVACPSCCPCGTHHSKANKGSNPESAGALNWIPNKQWPGGGGEIGGGESMAGDVPNDQRKAAALTCPIRRNSNPIH